MNYKFLDEEVRCLQVRLEEVGLVFDITVAPNGPIHRQVYEQVLDQCNRRGIVIVAVGDSGEDNPAFLPIVALKGNPKRHERSTAGKEGVWLGRQIESRTTTC